eukprot:scaffold9023_cov52-Phaeocystis_antarctica.AAC.1
MNLPAHHSPVIGASTACGVAAVTAVVVAMRPAILWYPELPPIMGHASTSSSAVLVTAGLGGASPSPSPPPPLSMSACSSASPCASSCLLYSSLLHSDALVSAFVSAFVASGEERHRRGGTAPARAVAPVAPVAGRSGTVARGANASACMETAVALSARSIARVIATRSRGGGSEIGIVWPVVRYAPDKHAPAERDRGSSLQVLLVCERGGKHQRAAAGDNAARSGLDEQGFPKRVAASRASRQAAEGRPLRPPPPQQQA